MKMVIALDDDHELYDVAINQHLNPFRSNVQLKSNVGIELYLNTNNVFYNLVLNLNISEESSITNTCINK